MIAFAAVAAAFLGGVFTFPRALEPGRSERDGITLPGALGSDWFQGSPATKIRALPGGGLALDAGASGLLLVSRGLPVDPDACYTALLRARAETPKVTLALYDEAVRQRLAVAAVRRTARPALHELLFDPGDRARIALAIIGNGASARVNIDSLRLVRQQC